MIKHQRDNFNYFRERLGSAFQHILIARFHLCGPLSIPYFRLRHLGTDFASTLSLKQLFYCKQWKTLNKGNLFQHIVKIFLINCYHGRGCLYTDPGFEQGLEPALDNISLSRYFQQKPLSMVNNRSLVFRPVKGIFPVSL